MNNIHKLLRCISLIALSIMVLQLSSCKKFLDKKSDKSLVVPKDLKDCQALLDDYNTMNELYPGDSEVASDDHYFFEGTLESYPLNTADNYFWRANAQHDLTQWQYPYRAIYASNQVLQILERLGPSSGSDYNSIKGGALFFRAFSFYSVAQLFCKPYDASTASQDMGIPLRLSPDLDYKSVRSTVQQTYERIMQDLKDAAELLPTSDKSKSRPTKAAALAMLGRVYLSMGKYPEAGLYANSCLNIYNTLIDYATITPGVASSTAPTMTRFNSEVIFSATATLTAPMYPSDVKVDPDLYNAYQPNDRRKEVFFNTLGTTHAFRGSYDGETPSLFCGLATDEVYLIRAESYARAGNTTAAMADLNTLMRNRWKGPFTDFTASSADDALTKILTERRKELIFRTLRWTDLRRLNKESRFAITLSRNQNVAEYTPLPPNDLRYTFLIPVEVVGSSGIQQNLR